MTRTQKLQKIQELREQLAAAEEDLKSTKVEIGMGDLARWEDKVYIITRSSIVNGGRLCGIRTDKEGVHWIDIHGPTEGLEFLKVTKNTPTWGMGDLDWISREYCKVITE